MNTLSEQSTDSVEQRDIFHAEFAKEVLMFMVNKRSARGALDVHKGTGCQSDKPKVLV